MPRWMEQLVGSHVDISRGRTAFYMRCLSCRLLSTDVKHRWVLRRCARLHEGGARAVVVSTGVWSISFLLDHVGCIGVVHSKQCSHAHVDMSKCVDAIACAHACLHGLGRVPRSGYRRWLGLEPLGWVARLSGSGTVGQIVLSVGSRRASICMLEMLEVLPLSWGSGARDIASEILRHVPESDLAPLGEVI